MVSQNKIFTFFILLFLIWSSKTISQVKMPCGIIELILIDTLAQKTFKLHSSVNPMTRIIDSNNYFVDCFHSSTDRRYVRIDLQKDDLNLSGFEIIIHTIVRIKKKYDVVVQQTRTGAFGHIYFVEKRGKIKLLKFRVGYI